MPPGLPTMILSGFSTSALPLPSGFNSVRCTAITSERRGDHARLGLIAKPKAAIIAG